MDNTSLLKNFYVILIYIHSEHLILDFLIVSLLSQQEETFISNDFLSQNQK